MNHDASAPAGTPHPAGTPMTAGSDSATAASPLGAAAGAGAATHKPDCLFCRIARGEIPSRKVYEDDDFVAFHDIMPSAPVHFLMVPRLHVENLYDADLRHQALLGRMMGMAGRLAREQGCDDGFRLVVNNGRVGRQEVYHLHLHVMGGPEPLGSGILRR